MFGLIDLMGRAAADAALAEDRYRDPAFLAQLREGKDVFRTFSLATQPAQGAGRREMPTSWRLRLDPARVRPLL